MSVIQDISESIQKGKAKNAKHLVLQALDEGYDPKIILNKGLLAGMMIVGERFKRDEVFVPEVLVASRAMNTGLSILESHLVKEKPDAFLGKVVLGTVRGDWHDIGKHMVAMMLRGAGFEVVDIGYDADTSAFIDTAEEIEADIICMSALLTTTMPAMQEVIDALKRKGLRDKYIVMIGGAPVNQCFAQEIDADIYTSDAMSCAREARKAVLKKRGSHEIFESEGGSAG